MPAYKVEFVIDFLPCLLIKLSLSLIFCRAGFYFYFYISTILAPQLLSIILFVILLVTIILFIILTVIIFAILIIILFGMLTIMLTAVY